MAQSSDPIDARLIDGVLILKVTDPVIHTSEHANEVYAAAARALASRDFRAALIDVSAVQEFDESFIVFPSRCGDTVLAAGKQIAILRSPADTDSMWDMIGAIRAKYQLAEQGQSYDGAFQAYDNLEQALEFLRG